jgi:hypothetical protein
MDREALIKEAITELNEWESLDKEALVHEIMDRMLTDEQVQRVHQAIMKNEPIER